MVTVVPGNREFNLVQYLIALSMLILAIVIFIYLWKAFIVPYAEARLLVPEKVYCESKPSRPINLLSRVEENRAYLSWKATSFTDSYNVYLGDEPLFQPRNAIRTISSNESKAIIFNLIPGDYYVKVSSLNTCGESELSNENSFQVTQIPSRFRICKVDNPSLCMIFRTDNNEVYLLDVENTGVDPNLFLSEFSLVGNQIKSADGNLCLNDNLTALPVVEEPVTTDTCPGDGDQWTFDFNTGRINSSNGVLLGSNSINGSVIFNTSPSVILNPSDPRYLWEIQARTF